MPPGFPTIVRSPLWIYEPISGKWVAAQIPERTGLQPEIEWYKSRGFCICIVKRQAGEAKPCLN